MPGHEQILNLPLNGDELKKIILADCQRLLDNECMLQPNVAFPRVAYSISLKLHMDNPFYPESSVSLSSKPATPTEIASQPSRLSIEAPPLLNAERGGEVGATTLTRKVDSGNAERLRNDMPIPCLVPQNDGTRAQESITYPPGSYPELGEGDVSIVDTTAQAKVDWNLLSEVQDIVIEGAEEEASHAQVPSQPS
jgi:hypothetical protein